MAGALVLTGLVALACMGAAGHRLRWLCTRRRASDVVGTVVARDRQFTGRVNWTFPVVEFTTRDGRTVRRTFRQTARPTVGRKLRIVYDARALAHDQSPPPSGRLTITRVDAMIYSGWLVAWLWLMFAVGLVMLAGVLILAADSHLG